MPEQAQAEIPQEAVGRFHALSPDQQQTAISRMTPELKARFLPAAQEYKAMHAPDSAYKTPQSTLPPAPTGARGVADKIAQFTTRNAPTIAGGVGGVAGGAAGGPLGAGIGAIAGGMTGGAIKSKAESGKVSRYEVGKGGVQQGLLELGGGVVGAGLGKIAKLLGVDEAMMKFALKRGEDYTRDLNPAEAMNKYHLHAMTTKELFQKTQQKIGTLSKTADAMIDQVNQYSSTVRPYAVIKGVIDQYKSKAATVGDDTIKDAMDKMLDGITKEFGPTGPSTRTETLMTPKDANKLKQVWGDSVQWGKEPPKDSLQAAYKATQNARRDIYHALNDSIKDALGGNQGRQWRATNHDIFNLMEAKGALQEAGERTMADAHGILPAVIDAMRRPGPMSTAARAATPAAAQMFGSSLPTLGRSASLGVSAVAGNSQNPLPSPPQ